MYENKNEKEDFIRCGKRVGWPEFDLVSEEGKMFQITCGRDMYYCSGSFSVKNDEVEHNDNLRDKEEEAYKLLTSTF